MGGESEEPQHLQTSSIFVLVFPGLTPKGTRERSTGSEEGGERKRQFANSSYFIAAVLCVAIEAQGGIFKGTFGK